jgi:hypothetical protein
MYNVWSIYIVWSIYVVWSYIYVHCMDLYLYTLYT